METQMKCLNGRMGGEGDDRGWDGWMTSPGLVCCSPWDSKELDMTEQ